MWPHLRGVCSVLLLPQPSNALPRQYEHQGRSVVLATVLACSRKICNTITNRCQLHISMTRGSSTPMNRSTLESRLQAMRVIVCTIKMRSTIRINHLLQQLLMLAESSHTLNWYRVPNKVLTTLGVASIRNPRNSSPSSPQPSIRSISCTRLNNHMPLLEARLA